MDLELADAEVPAVTRLRRSRLAFALAVSLAALPVLVVDNMSATAETNQAQVQATTLDEDGTLADLWTTLSTDPPSTTVTTEAPTTTTEAPVTTTTEAPATTDAAPTVQAVAAPAPTAPPATAPPTTAPPPPTDSIWDRLAQCESGGNWALNTGNGYYGGLQFSLATWQGVGGAGYPHQASRAEQIKRGQILQGQGGWGQWPHCARQLGLL